MDSCVVSFIYLQKRVFSIPATSSPSERALSAAAYIIDKKDAHLSFKKFGELGWLVCQLFFMVAHALPLWTVNLSGAFQGCQCLPVRQ